MPFSNRYIILFAAAICLACSIVVSTFAVVLKERQVRNELLEKQINVLRVAELIGPKESPTAEEADKVFLQIRTLIIDRKSGKPVKDFPDAASYDPIKAARDPATSVEAPKNAAKISRLPHKLAVYQVTTPGKESVILPIHGSGLWSTLYGFLALEKDLNTIKGLTFYSHGETPGLGGEVDNPSWKALWKGKKVFDKGEAKIRVVKGAARNEFEVDGLAGATLTANGVSNMLKLWLGGEGYGPFLRSGAGGT